MGDSSGSVLGAGDEEDYISNDSSSQNEYQQPPLKKIRIEKSSCSPFRTMLASDGNKMISPHFGECSKNYY